MKEPVIVVNKKNRVDAGSCSFCNREHSIVNVVTGETRVEVRFCNYCLLELSKNNERACN